MSGAVKDKRRRRARAKGLVLGKRRKLEPGARGFRRSFHVQDRKEREA